MIIPSPEGSDSFTVTFESKTGLLSSMEAMRWQEPASPVKKLWRLEVRNWQRFNGVLVPFGWALKWEDDSGAWFVANVEEAVYNVDVKRYIRARGKQ